MDVDFTIPLNKDDLLSGEAGYYVVEEVIPCSNLSSKVTECASNFRLEGPVAIIHSDNFVILFSVLRHFTELKNTVKEDAWEIILKAISDFTKDVALIVQESDLNLETRRHNLNTLKMLCYLAVQFTDAFEAKSTEPSTVVAQGKKKRGKSTSAASKKNTDDWNWEDQRECLVAKLDQLIALEIARLWQPPIPEDTFIDLITGCCYKLYENPSVTKNGVMKELLVSILGRCVKKYNHSLGASLKIVLLLQQFEHLVQPLAEAIEVFTTKFGVKILVIEIIREINKMDNLVMSKDSTGTNTIADFLVEIASRVPALVLPSVSLLTCHLDGDSYSMRRGVLGVFGEIIANILSKGKIDDNARKVREQMFNHLEDHIHDINAYVRSKSLQIFLQLCTKKAIPLPRQHHLLEIVIGRLRDKSSIVRKNALQLLKTFLIYNPFGKKSSISCLKKKLEEETTKLQEMAPKSLDEKNSLVPANFNEIWKAIEPEVRATVLEYIDQEKMRDEEDNPIELQENSDEAFPCAINRIRQLLNDGKHRDAVAILKVAMRTWPKCPAFLAEEGSDDPNQSMDESEEVMSKNDKEKKVLYQLKILKAIFVDCFGRDDGVTHTLPANGAPLEEVNSDSDEVFEANEPTSANSEDKAKLVNEIVMQQAVVNFLKDFVDFHTQMENAIPVICQLLRSKTVSDVVEAINFFVTAFEFGLNNAINGVRRMLVLVWSSDSAIKDSVVEAYKVLYLDPEAPTQRVKMELIVKNLITLTEGASTRDLTCLEALLVQLMRNDLIPAPVPNILWEKFSMKDPKTTPEESRTALVLLGMFAGAQAGIVHSNIDVLVQIGLGPRAEEDLLLARETCQALLKLAKTNKKPGVAAQEPFRLPPSHIIFKRLSEVVVTGVWNFHSSYWIPMAEQAVTVIYSLAEHPDAVCENILKRIAASHMAVVTEAQGGKNQRISDKDKGTEQDCNQSLNVSSSSSLQSNFLARFLSLAGHVAFRQLVHLEGDVLGEIKRRQRIRESEQERKKQAEKNKQKSTSSNTTKDPPSNENTIEDELGLTGATADDVEGEYIKKICDHEIVTGHGLLSLFGPLLVSVCNSPAKFSDPNLRAAASLALSKFMLVSAEFCEAHLQLLFTILEKSPHTVVRANIIVAVGDLIVRFPNLVEPWTPNIYARLRDESVNVRKNALMVLSNLILKDMVKVKGQISEMATCLEDKEPRIADLAKLFFFELSKKGNAIYNILPDIISRLSDPNGGVAEEPFRNILRYLFSFISKDRQSESLVEKLCHRVRAARTERQWRDLAFCLSLLSYNEKGLRKLQENFSCYHDKLVDEDVYRSFSLILSKSKKFAKPNLKTIVDELEGKFAVCHTKGLEDEANFERAATKVSDEAATRGKKATVAATPGKPGQGRKGRTPGPKIRRKINDSDGEEEEWNEAHKRNRKLKSTGKKRRNMPVLESDSEDEVELLDLDQSDENDLSDTENTNPNVIG